jgi:multidrug efflux system outer membrane protein
MKKAAFALPLLALSACTLAPKYVRPEAPVAASWPVSAPEAPASGPVRWRDLFLDARLQKTIDLAIANNRDLRVAVLSITRARAQYGIARSDLFPALDGSLSGAKSHSAAGDNQSYSANLGLSWELDLFGRVRSLNKAALEDFFSAEENRNAVQISLIGDVADAWLNLAADRDALKLAEQTLAARKESFDIAAGQAKIGTASDLDLAQAQTEYQSARQTVAQAETAIDQDKAALTLLVGTPLSDDLLPDSLADNAVAAALPVGLPSQVLLNRPDVLSAEHDLKAANADIGAARAALFPSISLTGAAGSASTALGDLFKSGHNTWSYGTSIRQSIFASGANVNGVRSATASRDIAVAQYEKTIQAAFRDVSDALAVRARIDERLDAQQKATDAAATAYRLSQATYKAGASSYLNLLDAQRTLYAAQQNLITLRALKASNLVALYQAVADDAGLR